MRLRGRFGRGRVRAAMSGGERGGRQAVRGSGAGLSTARHSTPASPGVTRRETWRSARAARRLRTHRSGRVDAAVRLAALEIVDRHEGRRRRRGRGRGRHVYCLWPLRLYRDESFFKIPGALSAWPRARSQSSRRQWTTVSCCALWTAKKKYAQSNNNLLTLRPPALPRSIPLQSSCAGASPWARAS